MARSRNDDMKRKARSSLPGCTICSLLLLCLTSFTALAADDIAANVTKLDGKAFAAAAGGATRTLQVNDKLHTSDKIITGKDAEVDITFTDGTRITLGASTIVNVDSYKYRAEQEAADPEEESFAMSIFRGTVRAFTGLLAKRRPASVRFATTVATIGVRGTHFVAEVQDDSATIILLAQEDPNASNAIEVSNTYGKVDIDKAGWGTEIPDATSPPSPPRQMQSTQSMNRIIRGVQTNRRVIVPRPRMH